ncbi:MAG TPA: tRNA (guanosine(46)-N7)-methyltransferase TrmB, partial [Planktomarina temperata]|nr:tRNA (guanosine(46)-N7)-methyltransferase TrmB [Planktomarina temperata]
MEHRNFYGRIKGKALNAAQERYLQEDLPKLSV